MSTSSSAITGIGATQIIVPPGSANAVFVDVQALQTATQIKYFSGGTLEIQGVNPANGSTYPGGSLVLGSGYIFGTSEALSIDGPARFYLAATGTTATAMLLRGLSAPGYIGTQGQ